MTEKHPRILIIRLGALGDLVFCLRAFHEVRQAYPTAEIALLTRAPFADFTRSMPWFDRVIIDTHPRFAQPLGWLRLRQEIADFEPSLILDFQGKTRQSVLYTLLGGPLGPAWSGAAPLCRYPRPWPPASGMHFSDFVAAQLRAAGVGEALPPDLGWLDAPRERFPLPSPYAVLIAGCSPGAPYKRWPAEKFAALAGELGQRGMAVIAVGTKADAVTVAAIKVLAPEVIDLCGKTSLFDLAGLLRRAAVVVGNDTGPTHLAAAVGAPTLALLSGRTNPVWSRPLGPRALWRQSELLGDLSVAVALAAVELLLENSKDEG